MMANGKKPDAESRLRDVEHNILIVMARLGLGWEKAPAEAEEADGAS
jgi:hypothetical protein